MSKKLTFVPLASNEMLLEFWKKIMVIFMKLTDYVFKDINKAQTFRNAGVRILG